MLGIEARAVWMRSTFSCTELPPQPAVGWLQMKDVALDVWVGSRQPVEKL